MELGFIGSREEYEEILKCRLRNYSSAGKVECIEDVIYKDDYQSEIIFARDGDKIVGTITLTESDKCSEIAELIPGFKSPFGAYCEASRFAIDTEYRSGDLRTKMFEYVWGWVRSKKHKVMLINSDKPLSLFYIRYFGFKKLKGVEFDHPKYKGIKHYILYCLDD